MPHERLILAIDIGTSAARAVLFDAKAAPVAATRKPYPMLLPQPGWSEQDPDTVFEAVVSAIKESLMLVPTGGQVEGIVLSSQLYSILAVDRSGSPLTNSLTWGDTRSSHIAAALRRSFTTETLSTRTGCPLQALYPLSKIVWLQEQHELPNDVAFLSIKDYVVYRLMGRFIADWATASATGLMDITTCEWDTEALRIAQITRSNLPELCSTRHILTTWQPEIRAEIDLSEQMPLILGSGDAPLANIGVGAVSEDSIAVNVGTSAAARTLITTPITDASQRLWTYVADQDQWIIGGIAGSCGVVYDWLLKQLFSHQTETDPENLYAQADKLAAAAPPGADDLLFIPYFSGGKSPDWNPKLRGSMYGLTLAHETKHQIRAALEGLAFALLRIGETLEEVRDHPPTHVYLTGGLTASRVFMQIVADVFGSQVAIPTSTESSARGAAILGWIALGYADTYEEFHVTNSHIQEKISPHTDLVDFYQARYKDFCLLNSQLQTYIAKQENLP